MTRVSDPRDTNGLPTGARRRAIVIGAGIGGLLAGRALADTYDEVLILERDTLPALGQNRQGIPQGDHVHGLMARGRTILETLFPGITDELVGHGALLADLVADSRWFQGGGYHLETASGMHTLTMTRPLLEGVIRGRVLQRPNVRILEGAVARGLLTSADRSRITGVRIAGDPIVGGDENSSADLVVDASGRGSQLPMWLRMLGYDAPEERRSGVETRYASRFFRRHSGDLAGKLAVIVASSPELRRGGVMIAQEGDRWLATLAGRGGEQPPTDLDAFIDFARSLPAPEIFEIVSTAEPLGEAAVYGFRSNQRRAYESVPNFPEGVLPFADGLCAFNPIYAQGMTVAAIEAGALASCLEAGTENLAHRFFAIIARDLDTAWKLAASADIRFVTVPQALPRKMRLLNGYMDRLQIAARTDPVVSIAFREVANLQQPPSTLMRPAMVLRVLRGNLGRRAPQPATPAPVAAPSPLLPVTPH